MSDRARSSGPLLEVEGLDVFYGKGRGRRHALAGATFEVQAGESVGVIGETGSGKSTLARAVLGLVRPAAGSVRVQGQEVTRFGGRQWREFRRRGPVQYVFQDPLRSLDPDLTVRDSIAESLAIRGERRGLTDRVETYLAKVNLAADLLSRYPGELSGGQRQRVAIARALITEPELLILDEPVSALDSANRVQVLRLLRSLREDRVGMLFISHDLGSVAGVTDRVIVLYRGQVVEIGPTAQIVNQPRHPYTRLLVGSAPTLVSGAIDRGLRDELRAELSRV